MTIPDLTTWDVIVVASSAGKDSQAMLDHVARLATSAGVLDRVTIVHNTLGRTPGGLDVEWPGAAELAAEQAAAYNVRYRETARPKGGLIAQLLNERRRWPSSSARWCTSDQKTGQAMTLVTRLVRETGITGRTVRVLYCLGLRAEESAGRARKPVLEVDRPRSSGVRHHPAYDLGMSRASCALCVLASKPDLIRACQLRPDLAAEYADIEDQLGHRFRSDASIRDFMAAWRNRPLATPTQTVLFEGAAS